MLNWPALQENLYIVQRIQYKISKLFYLIPQPFSMLSLFCYFDCRITSFLNSNEDIMSSNQARQIYNYLNKVCNSQQILKSLLWQREFTPYTYKREDGLMLLTEKDKKVKKNLQLRSFIRNKQ